jgi:hypothetical protein
MATKVFIVENQHVQNLAKYKKNNLVNKNDLTRMIK